MRNHVGGHILRSLRTREFELVDHGMHPDDQMLDDEVRSNEINSTGSRNVYL